MERGLDNLRLPVKEGLAIALSAVVVAGAKESAEALVPHKDVVNNELQAEDTGFGVKDFGRAALPSTVEYQDVSYTYRPAGGNAAKTPVKFTHNPTGPEVVGSRSQTTTGKKLIKHSRYAHVAYGSIWDKLAGCESTSRWWLNSGNGFYGGIQFTLSSWKAVGGNGMPNKASRDEQIFRGKRLMAAQGPGAWPACAPRVGLR